MGSKADDSLDSELAAPELDLDSRPSQSLIRPAISSRPSGERPSKPRAQAASYDPTDPQSMFGAGNFDADYFGDQATSQLNLGDAGSGPRTAGFGGELSLEAPASSAGRLELGDDYNGSIGDPFSNYGSGNLDFGDFDADDPFAAPLSTASGVDSSRAELPRPALPGGSASSAIAARHPARAELQAARPRDYPTGDTPAPSELPIDPVEAQLASEYGDAPSGWLLAPVYATKVFLRKRELQEAIRHQALKLQLCEQHRDEALADLMTALRPALEADGARAPLLEQVRQLEETSGARSGAFEEVKAEYESKCATLDQADIDCQLELEGLRQQTTLLDRAASRARENYQRAVVGFKRVQIELRAAKEVAARQQATATGSSEAAAQIQALEARQLELAPGVEQERRELEAREQPLRVALEQVVHIERQRADLAKQRKQLGEAYERQAKLRHQGVADAQHGLRKALADAGRELLRRPGSTAVDERALTIVREQSARVYEAALQLELWARAAGSYDAVAYRRGGQVILATVLVLVLLSVYRIVF